MTVASTVAATSLWSHYFLPVRYQSEAAIQIIPPRMPLGDDVLATVRLTPVRLQTLTAQVLSRSRLEPLVDEFKLYEAEREGQSIENIIDQMRRRDITISVSRDDDRSSGGMSGFRVGFSSPDPRAAMRVAERLASQFVRENLQEAEMLTDSMGQFVKAQIVDLRRQVAESEQLVEGQRQKGGRVAQADLIEYQVRQDTLKALLVRQQELAFAANITKRQIGEQFRIIDGARVPKKPVGPDQWTVNTAGGIAGLMIGLLLATVRSFRRRRE